MAEKQTYLEKVKSIIQDLNQGYASNKMYNVDAGSYGYDFTNGGVKAGVNNQFNRDQFRVDFKKAWDTTSISYGSYGLLDGDEPENHTYLQEDTAIDKFEVTNKPDTAPGEKQTKIFLNIRFDPDALKKIEALEGLDQDYESYVYNDENDPNDQRLINFRRFILNKEHADLILEGKPSHDLEKIWTKYAPIWVDIKEYPSVEVNTDFLDHSFVLPKPFTEDQVGQFSPSGKALFINKSSFYNYTNLNFETWGASSTVKVTGLPNFHNITSYIYAKQPSPDAFSSQLIIPGAFPPKGDAQSDEAKASNFLFANDYLNKYVTQWESLASVEVPENGQTVPQKIEIKNENICVTAKNYNFLSEFNFRALDLPFYSQIELRTTTTNELANFSNQTQMSKPLLQSTIARLYQQGEDFFEGIKKGSTNFVVQNKLYAKQSLSSDEESVIDTDTKTKSYSYFDLSDWINKYKDSLTAQYDIPTERIDFIGEEEGKFLSDPDPQYNFYKTMLGFIFKQKYDQMVEKYTRSFKDIMDGQFAYSEILFYEIQKSEYNDEGLEKGPVQMFWIQNTDDLDIIKLIDSQVKFGKRYRYRVRAHTAVFGTSYSYSFTKGSSSETGVIKALIINSKPSVRMYVADYYGYDAGEETEVTIWDNPPIAPNVSFQPIRTERNKIFISLNQSVDDFKAKPIVITDSDIDIFELVRQHQNYPKNDKLRFKSDSEMNKIQVFRIGPDLDTGQPQPPSAYTDFDGFLYKIRERTYDKGFSFVDDIAINKKYYYCFRSIDNHGNISNPSPVYEVEMIGQDGSLLGYPVINVIDMDSSKIMNPKKSFNRYLNLNPSPLQMAVDVPEDPEIQSSAFDGPPLGVGIGSSPLFTLTNVEPYNKIKKFKIRLTSKATGKKIDVNVRFIHKHIE
jgi:hypothetical protein